MLPCTRFCSRRLLRQNFRNYSQAVKSSPLQTKYNRVLILGAPGSGKGTYATVIQNAFGIPHISSGDLVREEIKERTELGKKMAPFYDKGELVPDSLVTQLMQEKLKSVVQKNGHFLLDGYPRNIAQNAELEKLIQSHPLNLVLNFKLPKKILLQKISARRICKKCGGNYNLANIIIPEQNIFMPPLLPKTPGICDKCGGNLIQRDDDREEIVQNRLKVYEDLTSPIEELYRKRGIFTEFDVSEGRDRTAPKLIEFFAKKGTVQST